MSVFSCMRVGPDDVPDMVAFGDVVPGGPGAGAGGYSFMSSLPPGWTLTRASGATYRPSATQVVSVGNNVGRFEPAGLLLEPQSQNVSTPHRATAGFGWGQQTTGSGTITPTPNYANGPDGTQTATLFSFYRTVSGDFANRLLVCNNNTQLIVPASLWVMAADAPSIGHVIDVAQYDPHASGYINLGTVTLTGQWQRKFLGLTPYSQTGQSGYNPLIFGYIGSNSPQTGTTNVLVWGTQAELGTIVQSSTILSGDTPVTRAADALVGTPPTWWQNPTGFTVVVDSDAASNITDIQCGVSAGSFGTSLYTSSDASGNVGLTSAITGGGATASFPYLPAPGNTYKLGLSIRPGGTTLAHINGANELSVNSGTPTTFTMITPHGCPWGGGVANNPGHLKRVRLWPVPLSSAALTVATT